MSRSCRLGYFSPTAILIVHAPSSSGIFRIDLLFLLGTGESSSFKIIFQILYYSSLPFNLSSGALRLRPGERAGDEAERLSALELSSTTEFGAAFSPCSVPGWELICWKHSAGLGQLDVCHVDHMWVTGDMCWLDSTTNDMNCFDNQL